ncbi:hypothetical protein PAXRUDRAFT_148448, partial [Paxillus rubicundulus Ve08.2h10]
GHYTITYNSVEFVLPFKEEIGPFHLIAQGRALGVVSQWVKVYPLVISVSSSSFHKVHSVQHGWHMILDTIDDRLTQVL